MLSQAALRAISIVLGALPHGLGQTRLAYRLISGTKLEGTVRQQLRGGGTFSLDLADRTQAATYMMRRYEPEIAAYITRHLPPKGILFDVGANIGLITFQVAHRRPDAHIVAFEPHPQNAERWRHNQALNYAANCRIEQVALSDRPGESAMTVVTDMESGYVTDSGDIPIALQRLDDYCATNNIERIDILKLDVQGSEPLVLAGAARMLSERRIGRIVCEVDDAYYLGLLGTSMSNVEELLGGYKQQSIPSSGVRRLRDAPLSGEAAFVAMPQ